MHGAAGVFGVAWCLSPMKSFTKLSQIWIAAGAMDWRRSSAGGIQFVANCFEFCPVGASPHDPVLPQAGDARTFSQLYIRGKGVLSQLFRGSSATWPTENGADTRIANTLAMLRRL